MRDKIYYDGELADYDDIERVENLYYTSKPVDVDDVSLDSEYDYRRLPKFIQEDIDYAESANDLISKGNFLDADDEEFSFNNIMKYEYKGDTYLIKAEGYNYPRYVVSVFEGRDKKDYWKGNDENEAYDQFSNARAENIKKNDVVLYEDGEEIDVYDAMEDLEQDDFAKGGDIKTMNMIELESIGTIIDPRTGMTYAMMADGKSYDPDTETHITEIDMSEYDYQITEKDKEILLDILQNPEIDEFAKGGMTGGFNPSGNVPIIKAKYYGMSDFGELIFKGDNGRFYVVVDGKTHSTTDDLEPMFPVLNVMLLDIPKDTGVSFERGGRLNSVLVKFKDPQYNYVTSIGANVSEAEAKNYFIGMPVNVASYPSEKFVQVIDIEYNPEIKARGGMVDYNDVKEEILDKYGYTIQEFNKGDMSRQEAQKIMKETNETYMKRAKAQQKDLGMKQFASGGMIEKIVKTGGEYDLSNQQHPTLPNRAIRYNTNNDRYEIFNYMTDEVDYSDRNLEDILTKSNRMFDTNFARGGKISKDEAIVKAMRMGVDFNKQFHAQSYGNELAELARETGYRKSKSSSGSLGRAFFEHLEKRYDKSPEYYDNISKNDMFAKGGLLEHGLKSGDRIMFPLSDNRIEVQDLFGQSKQVDLETGERT